MRASHPIEISHLSHRFRRHYALNQISLKIEPGITGLLGPNGAGKSTLLSILATVRIPVIGEVKMLNLDIGNKDEREQVRRQLGVLPQSFQLPPWMKVLDAVEYSAWTHGIPQHECRVHATRALDGVGIHSDLYGRKVSSLSGGQRQRVGIATAMAHRPKILLLDEPTASLDPEARMALRKVLREIGKTTTLILSTHLVEDVIHIADSLVVLNEGKLAYHGTPDQLSEFTPDEPLLGSSLEHGYVELLRRS